MAKKLLPPGFRFHPTDVELVQFHLKRKVMGRKLHFEAIAEVDIYKYAPWDLPDKSCLTTGDLKWYFFCPREKKYANGARMKRATIFGYWKATGNDRPVHYKKEVVGMIKTLVFHRGKAPRGDRTDWVMHEYRLKDDNLANSGVVQDAYVLCMIFKKDGPGPRNGAQYGAPFREEDWSDDEDEEINCVEALSSAGLSTPAFVVPSTQFSPVATSSSVPESQCTVSLPDTIPSAYEVPPLVPDAINAPDGVSQVQVDDDVLQSMLASFSECCSPMLCNENGELEKLGHPHENAEAPPCLDGSDIFKDLGDLGNFVGPSESGLDFSSRYNINEMLPDDELYMELRDLDHPF